MAFMQTNVIGTGTLLEASRNYWKALTGEQATKFRFLHVSTDEVFGSQAGRRQVHRNFAVPAQQPL